MPRRLEGPQPLLTPQTHVTAPVRERMRPRLIRRGASRLPKGNRFTLTGLKTMYIVVGDSKARRYSYVWRIWWHGTSFYIKAEMQP
jgi:hypothetical protein